MCPPRTTTTVSFGSFGRSVRCLLHGQDNVKEDRRLFASFPFLKSAAWRKLWMTVPVDIRIVHVYAYEKHEVWVHVPRHDIYSCMKLIQFDYISRYDMYIYINSRCILQILILWYNSVHVHTTSLHFYTHASLTVEINKRSCKFAWNWAAKVQSILLEARQLEWAFP